MGLGPPGPQGSLQKSGLQIAGQHRGSPHGPYTPGWAGSASHHPAIPRGKDPSMTLHNKGGMGQDAAPGIARQAAVPEPGRCMATGA